MVKFAKKILVLLVPVMLLTGCFEPKVDGSSKETFEASIKEVKAKLNAEETKKFDNAMQVIAMSNVQGIGDVFMMVKDPDNFNNFLMTKIDGMTAKQVIEEADAIIKAKGKEDTQQ